MNVKQLIDMIGADFYTGVPDSQLKALCSFLVDKIGISDRHIIAANEGNCVALAAGYHLATGKIPVIYMQNSGIGNIINPVTSLLSEKVYGIPCVFIVGWRGEPGVHDEPQHIFQGEISKTLLEDIGLYTVVLEEETVIEKELGRVQSILSKGKCVAFLVRKNVLSFNKKIAYENPYTMVRETALEYIVEAVGEDVIVSTTGKASRELFEIRSRNGQSHEHDFLTVGSMGHSSSIALGIALNKPKVKFWCIDGDGAVLMHMGAMAVIGANQPHNMVHVVINNEAHETVGGMPTVTGQINLCKIAEGCGYSYRISVCSYARLKEELELAKKRNILSFIEVKCAIGSRKNLGRPTTLPQENKKVFMEYLSLMS